MNKELKIGMYGEMPKIKVGKYTIADMTNEDDCNSVWIEDTESGEGSEFGKDIFFDCVHKFYKESY